VLQPGGSVRRTIKAQVASSLPDYLIRRQRGLFLIFPGTAVLELPGAGTYEVIVTFRAPRDHPIKRYLRKRPPLWEGSVTSNSLQLGIRSVNEKSRSRHVHHDARY